MSAPLLTIELRDERDTVLARQRARDLAARLGFDALDQTRIGTAVSEIVRNAHDYAGGGRVTFQVEGRTAPQVLVIRVSDRGPGIASLEAILEGRYQSPTGLGQGITGTRRLVDQFDLRTAADGTTVTLSKLLPRGRPVLECDDLARLRVELEGDRPRDAVQEVQRQNQELLRALAELKARQEELSLLNSELEDTNRGVVALYAELDEKADHLRRADEIKTRFISNMSHEFRTPVHSIQALAGLLLERADGDLTAEQERQVTFIRKAADALSELVSDLLDLAKIEAGKSVVHANEFTVPVLFGTLRGMLRPLLAAESVQLVFEDAADLPPLHTDEGKVSQILRNFISNALKFTERGEVRVSARCSADGGTVTFRVTDTGIGIAPEDQERIFQEFTQIDSPMQRRVKGTGLGLPLCRNLADLLGGRVSVTSVLGQGSEFAVEIPIVYCVPEHPPVVDWTGGGRIPVLVVEDRPETLLLYEKYLIGSRFGMVAARSLREARAALQRVPPRAIVLDILLEGGESGWEYLAGLRHAEATRDVPVMVVSHVEDGAKAMALGAALACVKPIDRGTLIQSLERLVAPEAVRRVLVVDDDEIWRYVLRQSLAATPHVVVEAATGHGGLQCAARDVPDLVLLDLHLPDLDGAEVLRRLAETPATAAIPVVVMTSRRLSEEERRALPLARAVLHKQEIPPERVRALIDGATGLVEASS